jgi:hypothetical protein
VNLKRAEEICAVIRAGEPWKVMATDRKGMSLDEIVRKLARAEVAAIKARAEEEIRQLQRRVGEYLSRPEIRKEVENAVRSYFRHPSRRASMRSRAGRAA